MVHLQRQYPYKKPCALEGMSNNLQDEKAKDELKQAARTLAYQDGISTQDGASSMPEWHLIGSSSTYHKAETRRWLQYG
jgi:hypothetical protein